VGFERPYLGVPVLDWKFAYKECALENREKVILTFRASVYLEELKSLLMW